MRVETVKWTNKWKHSDNWSSNSNISLA